MVILAGTAVPPRSTDRAWQPRRQPRNWNPNTDASALRPLAGRALRIGNLGWASLPGQTASRASAQGAAAALGAITHSTSAAALANPIVDRGSATLSCDRERWPHAVALGG